MVVLSEMYPQKFTRALGLLAELAVETKLPLLPKVCMPMSCWLVGVDKMDLFPVIKRHVHHVQLTDLSLLNDLEWITTLETGQKTKEFSFTYLYNVLRIFSEAFEISRHKVMK